MSDHVNHPEHYQFCRPAHEMADVTVGLPHAIGSAMEYLYRAGRKPNNDKLQDLRKAVWWIKREMAELEQQMIEAEISD